MSGNNQTRQPMNVSVTRSTQRFGSYPSGYQIINQSLTATVWAADNPSLKSGFGTPISPGTSIVWNTNGELYLCLGDDSNSVAAAKADVCISYDVSNWQPNPIAVATAILNSGVIVIDTPELVLGYANRAPGFDSGLINVSRYQSVTVRYQALLGGYWQFKVKFYSDSLGLLEMGSYTVQAGNGYTPVASQSFNVVGAYMRITCSVANVPDLVLGALGSFRRLTTDAYTNVASSVAGEIGSFNGIVNNGATNSFNCQPYFGTAKVVGVINGPAATGGQIGIYPAGNGLGLEAIDLTAGQPFVSGASLFGITFGYEFVCNGTSAYIFIRNNSGANLTYNIIVIPSKAGMA